MEVTAPRPALRHRACCCRYWRPAVVRLARPWTMSVEPCARPAISSYPRPCCSRPANQVRPMQFSKLLWRAGLLFLALGTMSPSARAGNYVPVSIAALTNNDVRTYTQGYNYPVAPTNISVAGVPFDLSQYQGHPNTL